MKSYGLGFGLGLAALTMFAGPAFAADLAYPAAPPPAGSPMYSPTSVVTGDFTLGVGWIGTDGNLDSDSASGLIAGRVNIPLWSAWNEEIEAGGFSKFNGDAFTTGIFSHTYHKTQSWAGGIVFGGGATDPFQGRPRTTSLPWVSRVSFFCRVPAWSAQPTTTGLMDRISGHSLSRDAITSDPTRSCPVWWRGTMVAPPTRGCFLLPSSTAGPALTSALSFRLTGSRGMAVLMTSACWSASATSSISRTARCRATTTRFRSA